MIEIADKTNNFTGKISVKNGIPPGVHT